MHCNHRQVPWLLPLLFTPLCASATEAYLCAQIDRIRAEETMPSIGAGVIVPDPDYPQYSPLQFTTLACASGHEAYGQPTEVTSNTQFIIGSITKPLTGLIVARVIADEATKRDPQLTWDTRLVDFFPHIATLPGSHRCYDQRTVADLMAHTAGFRDVPITEPNDQWGSLPDVVARRALYVDAAVIDPPIVNCTGRDGQPLAQLQESYSGGSIIAAHMAEVVTGRPWEDLVRRAGNTTSGPGLMIGLLPDPAEIPNPYASGHIYASDGTPITDEVPGIAPTNGPAGHIIPTVPQFARILTEFLDATKNDVNRQLPDVERPLLTQTHGLSNNNRLGWDVLELDTSNYGDVARWHDNQALFHNGGNGHTYAEAFIAPSTDSAMFAILNADGANRYTALSKVFSELAAMRLHHGEAADIVHKRKPATVKVNGSWNKVVAALGDGKLSSEWAAPTTSPVTLTLDYGAPTSIDRIVIAEDGGERIRRYELSYQDVNGVWHEIAKNNLNQDLIFPHRIFKVSAPSSPYELFGSPQPITAMQLRLRILDANMPPQIVEFAAANIPSPPRYKPLWWRHGFAEALVEPGPNFDPGPITEEIVP